MAYKVNYGLERAERNRAKQAKKEAKLRDRKSGALATSTDDEAPVPELPDEPGSEPTA